MLDRAKELEAFKSRINLAEYAASLGYMLDRKASSRSSAVMRHPNGDKLILAKEQDCHWVYFSVRDDADNGSIINFVQRRLGGSLGDVRWKLRPFLNGGHSPALPVGASFPTLEPAAKDLVRILARFEAMTASDGHPYLLMNARFRPRC